MVNVPHVVPEHPAPERTQLTPALALLFCTSFCTNALNPTPPPIEIVGAMGMTLTEIGVNVNCNPLLAIPATVKTTLPVVAPTGTRTTMALTFQLVGVAIVPLNETVLVPCADPKFVPEIVTIVLGEPEAGLRPVMTGVGRTVNPTPLLATPPTVTVTFPVAAPLGTSTMMLVSLQKVGVAELMLNLTKLVP